MRRLAAAVGADPLVAQVRCTHVQHERPTALSDRELSALLARPDLRTTIGVRDRAILELLARAGLRRSELARLTLADVQERGRQPDARRRTAIAPRRGDQTPLEVVVQRLQARPHPHRPAARRGARGPARVVRRPAGGRDGRAVRQPAHPPLRDSPSRSPPARSATSSLKHAAAAGVREDRRTAHALRHTFCTMLAERGVAMEVIRALAGHVDIRTTQIYVDVTDERKADGIAALERRRAPVGGVGKRARDDRAHKATVHR